MNLSNRTIWSLMPPPEVAAPASRNLVADACLGMSEDLTSVAELLVHEIVVNAFQHGTGQVVLAVVRDEERVRVEVLDENPTLPVVEDRGVMAEHGRGLQLVAALARQWGTAPDVASQGKWVWFEL